MDGQGIGIPVQLPALSKRLTVLISQEIEKLRPKYKLKYRYSRLVIG